jgi:hypothetical protein
MHNLKFIQQRFPKHHKIIFRVLFSLMALALLIGTALALWGR